MRPYTWLLIAFVTSGLVRIVVKLASVYDILTFIALSYFIGALFTLSTNFPQIRQIKKLNFRRAILFGIVIGLINLVAFYTQLSALSIGKASVIFPITSLAIYVAVVLSIIVYREKLTIRKSLGIIFSIIAILLLR